MRNAKELRTIADNVRQSYNNRLLNIVYEKMEEAANEGKTEVSYYTPPMSEYCVTQLETLGYKVQYNSSETSYIINWGTND